MDASSEGVDVSFLDPPKETLLQASIEDQLRNLGIHSFVAHFENDSAALGFRFTQSMEICVMENEQQVRTIILRVLNVAETGQPEGKPHAVYIYADGKNGRKQVTLGVGFTEDGGNLAKVLQSYVTKKGTFADQLSTHLPDIGNGTLAANEKFHQLLKQAGERDPLMAEAQKEVFSKAYLEPAFNWFTKNGFTLPLSFLVISDSYLHSGGIREALRNRFPETTPSNGGDEKAWVGSYVEARYNWLSNHSNKLLRNTVYRTQCFRNEIARENWMLDRLPINMNGVAVNLPAKPSAGA